MQRGFDRGGGQSVRRCSSIHNGGKQKRGGLGEGGGGHPPNKKFELWYYVLVLEDIRLGGRVGSALVYRDSGAGSIPGRARI